MNPKLYVPAAFTAAVTSISIQVPEGRDGAEARAVPLMSPLFQVRPVSVHGVLLPR
jgi:hypothetical protein